MLATANPALQVAGMIPTLYSETLQGKRALRTIQRVYEQVKAHPNFAAAILHPAIPRRTQIANAAEAHLPVAVHAPKLDAIQTLNQIVTQLEQTP